MHISFPPSEYDDLFAARCAELLHRDAPRNGPPPEVEIDSLNIGVSIRKLTWIDETRRDLLDRQLELAYEQVVEERRAKDPDRRHALLSTACDSAAANAASAISAAGAGLAPHVIEAVQADVDAWALAFSVWCRGWWVRWPADDSQRFFRFQAKTQRQSEAWDELWAHLKQAGFIRPADEKGGLRAAMEADIVSPGLQVIRALEELRQALYDLHRHHPGPST